MSLMTSSTFRFRVSSCSLGGAVLRQPNSELSLKHLWCFYRLGERHWCVPVPFKDSPFVVVLHVSRFFYKHSGVAKLHRSCEIVQFLQKQHSRIVIVTFLISQRGACFLLGTMPCWVCSGCCWSHSPRMLLITPWNFKFRLRFESYEFMLLH